MPRLGQTEIAEMENVIRNLMENAVKYSDNGVEVNVTIGSNGGKTTISVEDNGWGIPKKSIPHLFKQFYRVPRNDAPKGYGIGLALVKYLYVMNKDNKVKVLMVDDDVSLGEVVVTCLKSEGYDVEYVTSLLAMESMVKAFRPNVIATKNEEKTSHFFWCECSLLLTKNEKLGEKENLQAFHIYEVSYKKLILPSKVVVLDALGVNA